MLGAFCVTFNLMSIVFAFPASSVTFTVKYHSSLTVVHDDIIFQFRDSSTLQFFVTLSVHDATKISHI
jgi:hypothetical protein